MQVLGLVPARGGSKGIPRKNLVTLAGRPLIEHTLRAATASRALARTIVSTDDEEIAEVARAAGADVPFLRPDELAGDTTPMVDVVVDVVARLADIDGWRPDAVALLQPTSPLRRVEHIDEAVGRLRGGADTVVSVVPVPHNYSPYSLMRLEDDRLVDLWEGDLPFDRYRRQDQPVLYARNGPAVLVTETSVIERGSLYGDRVVPYPMQRWDSVDIDDEDDLRLAEWILGGRRSP